MGGGLDKVAAVGWSLVNGLISVGRLTDDHPRSRTDGCTLGCRTANCRQIAGDTIFNSCTSLVSGDFRSTSRRGYLFSPSFLSMLSLQKEAWYWSRRNYSENHRRAKFPTAESAIISHSWLQWYIGEKDTQSSFQFSCFSLQIISKFSSLHTCTQWFLFERPQYTHIFLTLCCTFNLLLILFFTFLSIHRFEVDVWLHLIVRHYFVHWLILFNVYISFQITKLQLSQSNFAPRHIFTIFFQ